MYRVRYERQRVEYPYAVRLCMSSHAGRFFHRMRELSWINDHARKRQADIWGKVFDILIESPNGKNATDRSAEESNQNQTEPNLAAGLPEEVVLV